MTQKQAIEFLTTKPYKFGHLLGFKDLIGLNNEWIISMVTGTDDKTLLAHRASYKTTCVSVALALIIILLPNRRTMFLRKTDNDVKEIISQVKKILENPKTQYFVQCIYGCPLKIISSNANELSTNLTNDPRGSAQLTAMGCGSSLTGKHFDNIFTDDIVNVSDRVSKAERDRTKIIYQELQNIKNRDGRIFNTGTKWHKDDCFTIMPNIHIYDCYSTGLIPDIKLAEIKESMTASLFACNYELKIIADEDVIFTTPQTGADPCLVEQGIMHVDSAFYGEDYTAMAICKVHDGKYYVFGKLWRKHVEDCYDQITGYYTSFMCGKCYMEKNADKGMVGKELRNLGMKMVLYNEKMNKYLKIVTYLKAAWKNVIFVAGTDEEYINQICDFNENANHDDSPDGLSSIIRTLYGKDGKEYVSVLGLI